MFYLVAFLLFLLMVQHFFGKINAELKYVKVKARLHGAKRARPIRVLAYISGYMFELRLGFKNDLEKIRKDTI